MNMDTYYTKTIFTNDEGNEIIREVWKFGEFSLTSVARVTSPNDRSWFTRTPEYISLVEDVNLDDADADMQYLVNWSSIGLVEPEYAETFGNNIVMAGVFARMFASIRNGFNRKEYIRNSFSSKK